MHDFKYESTKIVYKNIVENKEYLSPSCSFHRYLQQFITL